MILSETADIITIRVNLKFQELMRDYKVYTHAISEECRWTVGTTIKFDKNCLIEPYVGNIQR